MFKITNIYVRDLSNICLLPADYSRGKWSEAGGGYVVGILKDF